MAKRFTTYIIIANIIMGLLLYLSSQSVLIKLGREPVIVKGVNIFLIYKEWAKVGPSPIPKVIT